MSSLFSYELDEEQIRLTLQKGKDVDYSESNWDDFEVNYSQTCASPSTVGFKLPEFNLNINRNVVLPIVFIAGLVGVSAILLSFVDFKTNPPAQVEKQLIPDPNNFKPEVAKKVTVVKSEITKKTEAIPQLKKDSLPGNLEKKAETPAVIASDQPMANTATPSVINTSNVLNTASQSRTIKSDTEAVSDQASQSLSPVTQNYNGRKKKRRRKLPADQIETIKAPSLLGQEESSSKEPEMELKLN